MKLETRNSQLLLPFALCPSDFGKHPLPLRLLRGAGGFFIANGSAVFDNSVAMRLLIFLDTDHLSGPARLALDFGVRARQRGHAILVAGLVRGAAAKDNGFTRAMRAAGLEVRLLRERFRFDPSILGQFACLVREFGPDLYQSHGYKGSLLGPRAQRLGAAWQAVFHGFTRENRLVRLYHRLDARWLRRADEVIVVARPFADLLAARGVPRQRMTWVANAIDEGRLREAASGERLNAAWREGLPADAILAGVIGRFSPEKGPDHFLRALAIAARREPRLHAVMVGDGPMWESCRKMADALGLGSRVRFAGFRADVATLYEALDMLVIASRSEGMPMVLLEAMLMGAPVIATEVGALPDVVVDGESGLLVAPGDEEALAGAMARLAGDGAMRVRLAAAAGRLARERFSADRRAEILLERAQRLVEGRAAMPR
jgi:glycosyltransferase involved in cell wall biosynthesis